MSVECEHVGKSAVNSQLWSILQADVAVMGKQNTLGLKSLSKHNKSVRMFIHCCCVSTVTLKHFVLRLEFKHNAMSSIKITWLKNLMCWECSMSNLIESLRTTIPVQRKFEHENVVGKINGKA